LRPHLRLRLAADALAIRLAGLRVFAWYFLSPDMFRSETTDTWTGSAQQIELKTERVAIAYRLLFAYAFIRLESEQNSSHLQIDCDRGRGQSSS
jgi:hypothetical protein